MAHPTLKLPTLDKQVPHDAVVAFELLRRAQEHIHGQIDALEDSLNAARAATPTIEQISQALSMGGVAPVNLAGGGGGLPPSPDDPTMYLNGDALPAWAKVQDAHLLLFDILSNNVSVFKHGFMPKLTGNPDQVLNGAGQWVSLTTQILSWAPVTNGDPESPEILFDSNGEVIMGSVPVVP